MLAELLIKLAKLVGIPQTAAGAGACGQVLNINMVN